MTTATMPTQLEAATATMTDAELKQSLDAFDADIRSDGKFFNPDYLWKTAADLLQQTDIKGDAFIVGCAMASLTKVPRYGLRATHAQIARRAAALKKLFALADQLGWPRIKSALEITE
ncbi:MAG: hypothetical protein L0H94_14655 [Nitrospira sp.]|nr:hypothetical protein [Nitrospira sp.]